MEAITFGSRSIFGEIKTGVIPSLPGERKIVRHTEGQASECVDQQAMPGAAPAMGDGGGFQDYPSGKYILWAKSSNSMMKLSPSAF